MRMQLNILTAACLLTSSLLFVGPSMAASTVTQKTTVTNHIDNGKSLALPAGITAKNLNADNDIKDSFKGVTSYALDTTGFDNIVSYLNDQDNDRIKKSTSKSLNDIDGHKNQSLRNAIKNLDASWKAKYGKKFDLDSDKVYTSDYLHILTGEVSDPSLLIGQWPVGGNGTQMGGKATAADINAAKNKMFGGDVNLEKGREVAIARINGMKGLPGVTASLIHEHVSGWHFDIPNNVDAQTLYNNLVSNLTAVNNMRDKWPADVNGGYRCVTHAVILSLYNVDLQKLPKNGVASESP